MLIATLTFYVKDGIKIYLNSRLKQLKNIYSNPYFREKSKAISYVNKLR